MRLSLTEAFKTCALLMAFCQGRANRYLIGGGVLKNLGPFHSRGGVNTMFPKTKVPKIFCTSSFRPKFSRKFHNSPNKSLISQIPACQGPFPQVGPLFFTFLWGGVLQPPPPDVPGLLSMKITPSIITINNNPFNRLGTS
jgi:hypothetical protein